MPEQAGAPPQVAQTRLAELDEALRRETLASERLRALAVAGFTVALVIITVVYGRLAAKELPPALQTATPPPGLPLWIEAAFAGYALMALADAWLISRALRAPTPRLRPGVQFLSAFVETLLPSLLIFSQATMVPAGAFNSWSAKLYYLFIVLSTLRLNFWLSLFSGGASALQLLLLAFFLLPRGSQAGTPEGSFDGQILHAALLLLAGALAGAVGLRLRRQLLQTLAAVSARDHVTELFGQHVSGPVAQRLLSASGPPAKAVEQVCVLFVDIRDFTNWARTRSPEEVMSCLDETLTVLVEVVDAHQGFVNKFLGDGFLALFGGPLADPDAVVHAVSAARAMLAAMERRNADAQWQVRLGIGLHVGPAVAGTVGSRRRKEYTVFGDTVNLASRLEALNKDYGSQLLVSQQVLDAAGQAAEGAVPLGPVSLRGYTAPVPVWRLG